MLQYRIAVLVLVWQWAAGQTAVPVPGGMIAGQVLRPDGRVVRGAVVELTGAGGETRSARTDLDGSYRFGNLEYGAYEVEVAPGRLHTGAKARVKLSAQKTLVRQRLQLKALDGKRVTAPIPAPAPAPPAVRAPATARAAAPDAPKAALERVAEKPQSGRVLFATNRATKGSVDAGEGFFLGKGQRGKALTYGECHVNLKPDHARDAEVEEDDLLVEQVKLRQKDEFFRQVAANSKPAAGRGVLVFIHGYCNDFGAGAVRAARLAQSLQFEGAVVVFSWPSRGHLALYGRDERSAQRSVGALRRFLEDLAEQTQPGAIHLVAHSMGNRVLTRALAQKSPEPMKPTTRFRDVVMAAPDLAQDEFQKLAADVRARSDRVTLYASSGDLALKLSELVHFGQKRLGQAGSHLFIQPRLLDTIDTSEVEADLLDHAYIVESAAVLRDLRGLLFEGKAPAQRGLRPARRKQATEDEYWQMDAQRK